MYHWMTHRCRMSLLRSPSSNCHSTRSAAKSGQVLAGKCAVETYLSCLCVYLRSRCRSASSWCYYSTYSNSDWTDSWTDWGHSTCKSSRNDCSSASSATHTGTLRITSFQPKFDFRWPFLALLSWCILERQFFQVLHECPQWSPYRRCRYPQESSPPSAFAISGSTY